jgi:hypothetical protein
MPGRALPHPLPTKVEEKWLRRLRPILQANPYNQPLPFAVSKPNTGRPEPGGPTPAFIPHFSEIFVLGLRDT